MRFSVSMVFFVCLAILSCVISPEGSAQTAAVTDFAHKVQANCFHPLGLFPHDLWRLQGGDQSCVVAYSPESNADKLVIDFEFTASHQIEYLSISTPLYIDRENIWFGYQATALAPDGQALAPIWMVRCVDPSGETHGIELPFNLEGNWHVGQIKSAYNHYGGDNDGVLQFPCRMECILMDRSFNGWKQKGQFTLSSYQFFQHDEVESMITAQMPETAMPVNVLSPKGGTETVDLSVAPEEAYRDKPVQLEIQRQINGDVLPESIESLDPTKPVSITQPTAIGFESIRVTPFVNEVNEKKYGMPLKFAYAVLPEKMERNPWFGICTHLQSRPLIAAARAGIGMVRDDIIWASIEKEKGVYNFPERYDQYVDRALELGLEPLLIINYSNSMYDEGDFPHSDEAVAAYARYAAAVVEHFKGRCRHYEIWNEWIGGCSMSSWVPKKNNTPENYFKLIKSASEAIRKVDPDAFLVGGGGDHYDYHFKSIQKEMELGVMNYCDAYSVHPYIYPTSPFNEKMKEKMLKVIEVMKANGCEKPRLWLTELGYPTHATLSREQAINDSSFTLEDYSAAMLVQTAVVYRSIPEITNYFWYDLQNDGTNVEYNEHNFGLLHNGKFKYQPKASYAALACASQILKDATVTENTEYTTDSREVYTITRPDGASVLVAWTHKTPEEFLPPNTVRQVGLYGNDLPADNVHLTTRPTWYFLEK